MQLGQTGYVKVMHRWYKARVHRVFSTSLSVILLEGGGGNRAGYTVNCDFEEWKAD